MRPLRQRYYDLFSRIYDPFVRLHSRDPGKMARRYLADRVGALTRARLMDLCTGTGEVALNLAKKVDTKGYVLGIDFSMGMLRKAQAKANASAMGCIGWVQADAEMLPIKMEVFNGITCSHAFFELEGPVRPKALDEVRRVLKPGGRFCLMEHQVPNSPGKRLLFMIRSLFLGSHQKFLFSKGDSPKKLGPFSRPIKEVVPRGKSWLLVCVKNEED